MATGPSIIPYYGGSNPNDMISNDRLYGRMRGDQLTEEARARENLDRQTRDRYQMYGDEVYDPLIAGRGGYSPEEAAGIMREGDITGLYTQGNEDMNSLYMTDEERNAQLGDPYSAMNTYYRPEYQTSIQMESEKAQRGAARGLYDDMSGAIDEGQLGVDPGYANTLDATLTAGAGNVRRTVDPTKLSQSSDFVSRYRMTPQQQRDIVTGAGISAGTGYRAAIGDLERNATAAGMDPMGVAAAKQRMLRSAAGEGGDAMTLARIQASREAAGREMDIEGNRQQAEQFQANRGSQNELSLTDAAMGMQAEKERARVSGARDISDRRMQAAQVGGQANIDTERAINTQARQVAQNNMATGLAAAQTAEQQQAARAAAVTANRQDVGQWNNTQRFDRGAQVNTALAGRTADVAGARRADAAEGRRWLQYGSGMFNQNQQNEANRQVDLYGVEGQQQQAATANRIRQDQAPKWWERLIGAGAQAAGAAAQFAG
jgi:hypothetical protein